MIVIAVGKPGPQIFAHAPGQVGPQLIPPEVIVAVEPVVMGNDVQPETDGRHPKASICLGHAADEIECIQILMHGRTQIGFRGGQPEYKDFKVEQGGTIQSGDYFRFQAKVDKPAHIYVVFQDSAGKIDSMEKGSVPGGQDFFLPDGDKWFQLDKVTGTERLFMLASEKQIDNFTQKMDVLRQEGIDKINQIFPRAKIQPFSFVHQ